MFRLSSLYEWHRDRCCAGLAWPTSVGTGRHQLGLWSAAWPPAIVSALAARGAG